MSEQPPSTPPVPPPVPPTQPVQPQLGQDAGMRLLLPVGRSGWAIAAGYLGLFALLILPAPLALIIGIIAVVDIQRSAGTQHPKHGLGRAWFGIVMGALGTVMLLFMVIAMLGAE